MKKLLFLLVAVLTVSLASCSSDDTDKMLKTVPKDTKVLVIVNTKQLTEKLGKDGKEVLEETFEKAIKGSRGEARDLMEFLTSEDSQIDFSQPIIFFENNNSLMITLMVKNEKKFREGLDKEGGRKLIDKKDGYWATSDGNTFMHKKQVWFTSTYPEVTVKDIKKLVELKEGKTAADIEYVAEVLEKSNDVSMLINLSSVYENAGREARIVANMIMDDPAYISGSLNFEESKVAIEAMVLDSKFKPAKLGFKLSEINTSALKNFQGKGNMFGAVGLSSATMNQVVDQINSITTLPYEFNSLLRNIDGNLAASAYMPSYDSNGPSSWAVMISFRDAASAQQAADLLSEADLDFGNYGNVFAQGNQVYIMTANQQGSTIDSSLKNLEGAYAAGYFNASGLSSAKAQGIEKLLSGLNLKLVPDGDGLKVQFYVDTKGDQNALITILEFINKVK